MLKVGVYMGGKSIRYTLITIMSIAMILIVAVVGIGYSLTSLFSEYLYYTSDLESKEEMLSRVDRQITEKNQHFSSIQARYHNDSITLQEKHHDAIAQKEIADQTRVNALAKQKEVELQLGLTQNKLDALDQEHITLLEQVETLKRSERELKIKIDASQVELDVRTNEKEALEMATNSLSTDKEKLIIDVKRLLVAQKATDESVKTDQIELEALVAQIKSMREELTRVQQNVGTARSMHEALLTSTLELKTSKAELDKIKTSITNFSTEQQVLKESLAELTVERDELRVQKNMLSFDKAKHEDILVSLAKQMTSENKMLEKFRQELLKLEAYRTTLTEEISQSNSNVEKATIEVKSLEQKKILLKAEVHQLESQRNNLTNLRTLEEKTLESEKAVHAAQATLEKLLKNAETVKRTVENAQKQLDVSLPQLSVDK